MLLLSTMTMTPDPVVIASHTTPFTADVELPKFNPALGVLQSVRLYETVSVTDQIQLENLSRFAKTISVTDSGVVTLHAPTDSTNYPDPLLKSEFSDGVTDLTLPGFDGVDNFAGASGYTGPVNSYSLPTTSVTLDSASYDLSPYIIQGATDSTVKHLETAIASTSSQVNGGSFHILIQTSVGATVGIQYTYIPYGSLGDTVYLDTDADGYQGSGEPGVEGVTVDLLDGSGNPVLDSSSQPITTTTNSSGNYLFSQLLPGDYSVKFELPPGYQFTKHTGTDATTDLDSNADLVTGKTNVVAIDGNSNLTLDAGLVLPAALSGNVYYDANDNGQFESTEAGIGGVLVSLSGTDYLGNSVSLSTTTSSATGSVGAYSFPNLLPGTYTVSETQPSSYLDGQDTAGSSGGVTTVNDVISAITLNGGDNSVDNNFGELLPAKLSGYVYADANNNGVKETGEAPIPGTGVTLYASDGTTVLGTATTDANGYYEFPNLLPGSYVIKEAQPSGYLDGLDAIGSQGGTPGNDVLTTAALVAGTNGINNNFGELLPAKLSGYVYADANNNGVKETGEAPISGVTVKLYDSTGTTVLGTATTNASGYYEFTNLVPGSYVIKETQPSAYLDGKDAIGSQGGTTGNDVLTTAALVAGTNGINNNFGELLPATASICGTVWYDCNANATIDSTEMGRSGVTVYLDANGNGQLDAGETSTTTDSNGNYTFTGLAAGSYKVREVIPLSFRQSTANPATITLASNGKASKVNFGLTATTDGISNFTVLVNGTTTYGDLRGNTSAGDLVQITFTVAPGVVNLPVNLVSYTAPDSSFVASHAYQQKVYDVDGGLFSTGTYTLTVVNPNSYFQVDFVVGCVIETLGGSACNYDANDFYTPQGRLISADNGDSCATAPLSNPGVITGTVFRDADCDGKLDSGEQGVGPVKVYLDTNNNGKFDAGEYATFTHPDGSYQFGNLAPGTYRVRMVTPAGQTKTSTDLASVKVTAGSTVAGGNFGLKLVSGNTVGLRTTESIDWWNGATGQALIKAFGGSSSSTGLGTWLATTFPKLYGSGSSCNLSGKSNSYVASRFQSLYGASGDKLEAKAMSLALSVYATTSSLGGVTGMFYGFAVTTQGLGASTYSGSTILSILTDLNSSVSGGKIYGSSSSQRTSAGTLLDQVLLAGDSDRA